MFCYQCEQTGEERDSILSVVKIQKLQLARPSNLRYSRIYM